MAKYTIDDKVKVTGKVAQIVENEAVGIRYQLKLKSQDTIQRLWFEEDEIADVEPKPEPEPDNSIMLIPESPTSVLFGTSVADMQHGVVIKNNSASGTIKKLTEGALVDAWGEGNFIALRFYTDDWSKYQSVKVGMNPSYGHGLVEIINDDDKDGAFKITNKDEQKFEINIDGTSVLYDLSDLVLES